MMQSPQTAEVIESPARILQLLKRACDQQSELQVQLNGANKVWRTTVHRIEQSTAKIIYGQLTPSDWRDHFKDGQSAHIFNPSKDNCISFEEPLSLVDANDSLAYLESPIPRQLRYEQLRGNYRINLKGRQALVTITNAADVVYQGEIINISTGGCRCFLQVNELDLGDPRETMLCHLHIEELLELECGARVCHLAIDAKGITLSMELTDLDASQIKQLQRCIVEIERSTMRRIGAPVRSWRKRSKK